MLPKRTPTTAPKPALLTGTSTEYQGRRALPRVLLDRSTVVLLGPPGVGKSTVASHLASAFPAAGRRSPALERLDARALEESVVARVRSGAWRRELMGPALVLDGPVWLRNRPSVTELLAELLRERAARGCRTVVVQQEPDGSAEVLIGAMETGSIAVLALRFPSGRASRMRVARQRCAELGLPRELAARSVSLDPWSYAALDAHLASVGAQATDTLGGFAATHAAVTRETFGLHDPSRTRGHLDLDAR